MMDAKMFTYDSDIGNMTNCVCKDFPVWTLQIKICFMIYKRLAEVYLIR